MADPWPNEDPWQMNLAEGEPPAMQQGDAVPQIRVVRLNGEVLEVCLTRQEASKLVHCRDLKLLLARHDLAIKNSTCIPGMPFFLCWMRLFLMDANVEIKDAEPINWVWLEQGSLQYVIADPTTLALEELPSGGDGDLIFFYEDLEQLLDPKLLATYAFKLWKRKGQAFCEHVLPSWSSALLNLPANEVNQSPDPRKKSILQHCLTLLHGLSNAEDWMRAEEPEAWRREVVALEDFHDQRWPGEDFEAFLEQMCALATTEFVERKLEAHTMSESFRYTVREHVTTEIWTLVQGLPNIDRHIGGLRSGRGADLVMAMIDKGLPREYWACSRGRYDDNLLQYIMAPVRGLPLDWYNEDGPKATLCSFLAQRFTLEELCHRNKEGENALSFAEDCQEHQALAPFFTPVCDEIRQQMQARASEMPGSLLAFVEVARSVRAGLGGLADLHEDDPPGILATFEEQMWQRASVVRQEWLRMGWIFMQDTCNGQISEVLNWHLQAVGRGITRYL